MDNKWFAMFTKEEENNQNVETKNRYINYLENKLNHFEARIESLSHQDRPDWGPLPIPKIDN